jgi:hypothetical protein
VGGGNGHAALRQMRAHQIGKQLSEALSSAAVGSSRSHNGRAETSNRASAMRRCWPAER